MTHAELLERSLPPVAYDHDATILSAALEAEGNALDVAQSVGELILTEADPRSTYEFLADWERVLGLPGDCAPLAVVALTVEQRRAAVVAKLAERGGTAPAYFIALAVRLGFEITITEGREWTFDSDDDAVLYGADWDFAWLVNALLNTVNEWTFDSNDDTPFAWWGNELLECAIRKYKPAHTVALFAYI